MRCFLLLLTLLVLAAGGPCGAGELSAVSSELTITVAGGRATGRCLAVLEKTGERPAVCPLFAAPMTPSSLTLTPGLVLLPGAGISASASAAGTYRAEVHFLLPLVSRDGARQLVIPVPQTSATSIRLALPGENAAITADVAVQADNKSDGTTATIYPGGRKSVTLTLNPGFTRKDGELKLATQVDGRLTWKNGILHYDAEYRCDRLSGEGGALVLGLPGGWVLGRIAGADITGWQPLATDGALPAAYRLQCTGADTVRFTLSCSLPAGFGEQRLGLELPMPQETSRAGGSVVVVSTEESSLSAEDLTGAQPGEAGMTLTAPEVRFALRSQPRRFAYDCRLFTSSRLSEHVLLLRGQLQVQVREGGRYRLPLRTNPGLRISSLTGPAGLRWTQEGQDVLLESSARIDGCLAVDFTAEISSENGSYPLPWLLPPASGSQNVTAAFTAPEGTELVRSGGDGRMAQTTVAGLPAWMQPAQLVLVGERVNEGGMIALNKLPPSVEALSLMQVRLEDERAQMKMVFLITPRRIATFRHRLLLGAGMDVSSVTGALIRDWDYEPQTGVLTVSLNSACPAGYRLEVNAARMVPADAPVVPLDLPGYEGATLMRGFASVLPSAGWELSLGQATGVRPCSRQVVAAYGNELPMREGELLLAYQSERLVAPVMRRTIPAEVRVRQQAQAVFMPGMVRFEARLEYTVARGGVQVLRFVPPAGFGNIEIASANGTGGLGSFRAEDVRAGEQGEYRVEFPSRLDRVPMIVVRGERVLPADGGMGLTPVRLPGCGRDAGTLSIFKPSSEGGAAIDVREQKRDGLERQMANSDQPVQGLSRIGSYDFEADTASVDFLVSGTGSRILQAARAGKCELASRLTDNGDLLTRLRCRIENPGGQQFLAVTMPSGSRVWGAFSDGEPVKPVQDGARLLVPLESGKAAFDLDLIYEQKMPAGGMGIARMELGIPQLSVPGAGQGMQVDRTDWRLWVPEDYDLISHGGTLNLSAGRQAGTSYLLGFARDLALGLVLITNDAWRVVYRMAAWLLVRTLPLLLVVGLLWLIVGMFRKRSQKGRFGGGLLTVFLVLCILVVFLSMLTGPLMNARVSALKVASTSNLSQIGKAIYQYSSPSYYGVHPNSLEDLMSSGLIDSQKMITSPLGGTYAYAGVPDNAKGADVIAVELLDDSSAGTAAALYLDGHVKTLSNEDIMQALRASNNYPLLNRFVDHLQQGQYASQNKSVFFGGKAKQMASIGRETEELQMAQQELQQSANADTPQAAQTRTDIYRQRLALSNSGLTQEDAARQDVKRESGKLGVRSFLRRSGQEQVDKLQNIGNEGETTPESPQRPVGGESQEHPRLMEKTQFSRQAMSRASSAKSEESIPGIVDEASDGEVKCEAVAVPELKVEVLEEPAEDSTALSANTPVVEQSDAQAQSLNRAKTDKMRGAKGAAKPASSKVNTEGATTRSYERRDKEVRSEVGRDKLTVQKDLFQTELTGDSKPAVPESMDRAVGTGVAPNKPLSLPDEWKEIGDQMQSEASNTRKLSEQVEGKKKASPGVESSSRSIPQPASPVDTPVAPATASGQATVKIGGDLRVRYSASSAPQAIRDGVTATPAASPEAPEPAAEISFGKGVSTADPISGSVMLRARELFAGASAGALPIKIEIPENGRLLAFSRGPASDGGAIRLCFLSRGVTIAFELLVALGVAGGLYLLHRRRPGALIPASGAGLLLALLALQWAQSSYRPQLVVAMVVFGVALLARILPYAVSPLRRGLVRILAALRKHHHPSR